uniref:GEVED domain-containing protein n=1 Tax=Hymenobacter terrenus TaxID=1629124 RepID=UPI0006964991
MKKLLLSLLLGLGAWSGAHATEYYVSNANGNDATNAGSITSPFRTIQYIANLKNSSGQYVLKGGDIVNVRGTNTAYTNAAVEANSYEGASVEIKASGSSGNYIIFRGYPQDPIKPLIKFSSWEGFSIKGNVSYVEIRGFRIQGNNSKVTLAGARAQPGTCDNPGGAKQPEYLGSGIAADGTNGGTPHHLRFIDNEVFECGTAGISAINSDYVTIENNLVYNNSWYTVFGSSGISVLTSRNYNSTSSNDAGSYHITVRNNRSFGNKLLVKWYQGTCKGITDGNGIIIDKGRVNSFVGKTLVANNLCVNNGGSGIQTFKTDNVDVINNTCYRNSTSPELSNGEIFANDSDNILIQNNISVSSSNERVFSRANNGTNVVTYANNLFFGNTITQSGSNISSIGTVVVNGTYVPNGPSSTPESERVTIPLGSNKVADPLFNGQGTSLSADFTLQPTSPAINAGVNNKLSTTDLAGNTRVVGGTVDIGAYESTASTPPPATCGVPSSLSTSGVSSTGATLAWAAVSGASSYNVRYRVSGATSWTNTTSTGTSKALTGLAASTDYEFQVQTVCSGGSSTFSASAPFSTTSGGTTPPPTGGATYCASKGNDASYEHLAQVSLGSINRTSGSDGGYYDGTATTTNVAQGSSQTITYKAGFSSDTYTEYVKVYIDWNQDGDFADTNETVASGTINGTTAAQTASFTVPTTATAGKTRLRVVMSDPSTPVSSCGTYQYGETEDYSVTVTTSGGGTTTPPPPTTTLRNPDNPTGALAPGVNYNYYQGTWTQL